MFTGIIQKTGRVVRIAAGGDAGALHLATSAWDRPYVLGESIAVNGVCLTLAGLEEGLLRFDVLRQTFQCSNLGTLREGGVVNLERALRYGDALGGHLLSGHVDAAGLVRSVLPVGRDRRVEVEAPTEVCDYLIAKGSIGCDGISLTVAELLPDGFAVHLIPTTLQETSWGHLVEGDRVNLEVDMVCKMVYRAAETGRLPAPWSWEAFQRQAGETPSAV